jgi:multiple sugar transport system substrate-binding protein
MNRKILLTLISIFMVAGLLLSACAPSAEPTQAPAEEGAPEEEAAPAGEEVTIRVWTHQNDAFNSGLESLAEAYMAENPNVTINFETFDYDTYIQTLQTALPAGTEADILQMFGSWVCSYVEGGNLAEVPSGVLTVDEAEAQVFAAQLAGYACDDKLYGVPQEFNIEYGAALVNTQIAADAGLTNITDGWSSWDDFIADVKQLAEVKDGVMTRAGYNFTGSDGTSYTFYSLILQNGGQYLTDDGFSVNTPEGMKALELMKKFVDEGLLDPVLFNDEENWVGDSFFEETSATGLVGPWVIPEYAGDFEDVAAVTEYVALPSISADPVFAAASGWGLTVSTNSEAQDAAWDFVKFVTLNPDNAVQWNIASGTLPALKANATGAAGENLVAEFPYFEPFLKILEYGQNEGKFPDRDLVWYDITYPRILNFLQGNATAEETLETIEREVNESF